MKRRTFDLCGITFVGLSSEVIKRISKKYVLKSINVHVDQDHHRREIFYDVHYGTNEEEYINQVKGTRIYFHETRADYNNEQPIISVEKHKDSWFFKNLGVAPVGTIGVNEILRTRAAFFIFHKGSKELANFKMRYE